MSSCAAASISSEVVRLDVARRDAPAAVVQQLADRVLVDAGVGGGGRVRPPQRVVRQHAVTRQAVAAHVPIGCPSNETKLGVLHVRERCRVTRAVDRGCPL